MMSFGKYRGEVVETVVRADPSYIDYISRVSERIKFHPSVLLLVADLLNQGVAVTRSTTIRTVDGGRPATSTKKPKKKKRYETVTDEE